MVLLPRGLISEPLLYELILSVISILHFLAITAEENGLIFLHACTVSNVLSLHQLQRT